MENNLYFCNLFSMTMNDELDIMGNTNLETSLFSDVCGIIDNARSCVAVTEDEMRYVVRLQFTYIINHSVAK